MSKSPIILVGALVAGLVGGFTLRDTTTLPIADASTDAQDWKPRNTIQRDIGMSAEELDGQQPDAGTMGSRPAPRPMAFAQSTGSSWSYGNCRMARAAGAAPLYRGQPGYGAHMDGDNDGVACEPYMP